MRGFEQLPALLPFGIVSEPSLDYSLAWLLIARARARGSSNSPHVSVPHYWGRLLFRTFVQCYSRLLYHWATAEYVIVTCTNKYGYFTDFQPIYNLLTNMVYYMLYAKEGYSNICRSSRISQESRRWTKTSSASKSGWVWRRKMPDLWIQEMHQRPLLPPQGPFAERFWIVSTWYDKIMGKNENWNW